MTAIKTTHKYITLDLNKKRFVNSSLSKILEDIKLTKPSHKKDGVSVALFLTTIKIGIFNIDLNIRDFTGFSLDKQIKLSDIDNFNISIWETNGEFPLNLEKSDVFKNQKWIINNYKSKMTVNELIEAIIYCKRVSNIKSFL